MDELFEKLKSEPSVNTMPPPKTPALKKANYQKTVANLLTSQKHSMKVRVLLKRKIFNLQNDIKIVAQDEGWNLMSKQKRSDEKENETLTKIRKCCVKIPRCNFILKQYDARQNGTLSNEEIENNFESLKLSELTNLTEQESSADFGRSKKLPEKHKNISKNTRQSRESLLKEYSSSRSSIATTKFPRSQLITTFGVRFFQSRVRIERAKHPLMVIFEENAKNLKQARINRRSKNLSVSFLGQVEVFGDSSSDHDSRCSVDSGKVADDDDTPDRMHFTDDPHKSNASTPKNEKKLAQKQKEKKSYSPLKKDATTSPNSEKLKKANEKIHEKFQHLIVIDGDDDVDDDDDNDEEEKNEPAERIVPAEISERCSSPGSSPTISNTASNKVSREIDENPTDVGGSGNGDVSPDIEIVSPIVEDKSEKSARDSDDGNQQEESFGTVNPAENNQIEVGTPTRLHNYNNEDIVAVLADDRLVNIFNNSLEEAVLPTSINSETTARDNITESGLPEISSNTFDSIFDDGDVFMSNLQFPSDGSHNLVEKSSPLTMQGIIDEREKMNIPPLFPDDDQSVHSDMAEDSTGGMTLNVSEDQTLVSDQSDCASNKGKFSFSRIFNSVKSRITQSRLSSD